MNSLEIYDIAQLNCVYIPWDVLFVDIDLIVFFFHPWM